MPHNPPNEKSRCVQLGAELRAVRHSKGLTLQQLAGRLGRDHSTVSRWERGATKPSIQDASAFLAVLDVIGEERDRILELTQHDGLRDWIVPPVGQRLAALMEYERVASVITEVNPLLIPGLLQTRAYARSIMLGWGAAEEEADRSAAVRGDRQGVLTRRNPAEYVAVIGASALVYPPCSGDIMREQCDRLLAMSVRPNISLRILPQRKGIYNPSLDGPFILLDLPRDTPVVYLESYGATSIITNRGAIDLYLRAIDELNRAALSESESARFIRDIRERQ
jgi:transcriptional regulator with XRE-family HTH domain